MSVVSDLATTLATDWAAIPALANLRIVATERDVDNVTESTVFIRGRSIARTPEAPLAFRNVKVTLQLTSAHEDLDFAADELEILMDALLDYLDVHQYRWEESDLAQVENRLAYFVPITVYAARN